MTRHNVRGVVCAWSEGESRFLMLLAQKGYWQNPNGGRDEGETEVEAVLREIKEETGLTRLKVLEHTRTACEYDAVRRGMPIHVHLAAFLVEADATEKVTVGGSEDKHSDFRWVTYGEALAMLDRYPEQGMIFTAVCGKGGIAL